MKSIKSLIILIMVLGISGQDLFAQRVSATVNLSQFRINRVNSDVGDINYEGSSSITANLRLYTKNKWAFRFGAGMDNLNYTVGDGLSTDYKARRQDLKGIFGIEKHFNIAGFLDLYPGLFVPVVVTGKDVIDSNFDNIKNGETRAGLGVVLGANVKFLKILRLGVELDATYDNFSNQIWESAERLSVAPIKGINFEPSFTLGVAF